MRNNDKMHLVILLIAVLAAGAIMFMIYLFSTQIGPSPEDYTVVPLTDAADGRSSSSLYRGTATE